MKHTPIENLKRWYTDLHEQPDIPASLYQKAHDAVLTNAVKLPPELSNLGVDEIHQATLKVPGNLVQYSVPDGTLTVYRPAANSEILPVVLWIHGGAWMAGTAEMVTDYARLIAAQGYVVASLGYSLAPDHIFPTQAAQAVEALNYLVENAGELGANPRRIFIGGNSAGGHLAANAAALVTNLKLASEYGIEVRFNPTWLAGTILVNGIYHLEIAQHCGFPGIGLAIWALTGVKDADEDNYPLLELSSPALSATELFPSTLITAGDMDPLEKEARYFAATLKRMGVPVETKFFPHGSFYNHDYVYNLTTAGGRDFFTQLRKFLASV